MFEECCRECLVTARRLPAWRDWVRTSWTSFAMLQVEQHLIVARTSPLNYTIKTKQNQPPAPVYVYSIYCMQFLSGVSDLEGGHNAKSVTFEYNRETQQTVAFPDFACAVSRLGRETGERFWYCLDGSRSLFIYPQKNGNHETVLDFTHFDNDTAFRTEFTVDEVHVRVINCQLLNYSQELCLWYTIQEYTGIMRSMYMYNSCIIRVLNNITENENMKWNIFQIKVTVYGEEWNPAED